MRYVIHRNGIIRGCDNPKDGDRIVGWYEEGRSFHKWRPLQRLGAHSYKAFTLQQANQMIEASVSNSTKIKLNPIKPIDYVMIDFTIGDKKCECGSEKAKIPGHSTWCPKFEK